LKIELGRTGSGSGLSSAMLSVRKSITTEEKEGFLAIGQLYRGYAGLMLSLRGLTVDLWLHKWEDTFPRFGLICLIK
jgi:hypothetical protein